MFSLGLRLLFFFFNDTATTEIYTLSLLDALPISFSQTVAAFCGAATGVDGARRERRWRRSEEHTSELPSQFQLVCRLLLEKKKRTTRRGRPTPPTRTRVTAPPRWRRRSPPTSCTRSVRRSYRCLEGFFF